MTLALPTRATLIFDEALLSLPPNGYPDYIFLKRDSEVIRLPKYAPWMLRTLVTEAGFSLYEELSNVQRGVF